MITYCVQSLLMISKKGFTLIELLIVIGVLSILLTTTIIAINPTKQFAKVNDAKRISDVNAIANALGQCLADSKYKIQRYSTGTYANPDACTSYPGTTYGLMYLPPKGASLPIGNMSPRIENGITISSSAEIVFNGIEYKYGGNAYVDDTRTPASDPGSPPRNSNNVYATAAISPYINWTPPRAVSGLSWTISANLCPLIRSGYIAQIPYDPTVGFAKHSSGSALDKVDLAFCDSGTPYYFTGYYLYRDYNDKFTIYARREGTDDGSIILPGQDGDIRFIR